MILARDISLPGTIRFDNKIIRIIKTFQIYFSSGSRLEQVLAWGQAKTGLNWDQSVLRPLKPLPADGKRKSALQKVPPAANH
jgi:hypothetical protein